MFTPWGISDSSKRYGEGITFYTTPSHGGFRVSRELNAQIPDYMKTGSFLDWNRSQGWYEEDCDWAIVAVVFPDRFTPEEQTAAIEALKNWHPAGYEKWTGQKLLPGESYMRDRDVNKL